MSHCTLTTWRPPCDSIPATLLPTSDNCSLSGVLHVYYIIQASQWSHIAPKLQLRELRSREGQGSGGISGLSDPRTPVLSLYQGR